jgi:hypothetical protein
MKTSIHLTLVILIAHGILAGCTTIAPVMTEDETLKEPQVFSHELLDNLLKRYVDGKGLVNYENLAEDPTELDVYYSSIATYSPDSHPGLFPTDNYKLAYWINAYNASAIKTVMTYYPISSVLDVKQPAVFFFLSDKSGFFFFQRLTYGGKSTSLYYLENGVIRKRFNDPRIHFALNCAARGCPYLPREAFTGEQLNAQLDRETRKFLSQMRNFNINHQEKVIYMSSIFKWYEKDFITWYKEKYPHHEATLLNYIVLYLPSEKAAELKTYASTYPVRFMEYDWTLNDQRSPD